ncbi:MAG TPA: hypothetical protein VNW52_08965 [Burkholderiaceae bacterium]|nr:hypothetical protein [Burkholderiaceae bacterium]
MPILLLKLLLVPSLIGLVTLSGRRWGPSIAGWLSAFPIVSGPILFFIAMEHGNHFAAVAATATLSAVVATIVFGLAYAWAATRFYWPGSLVVGLLFYGLAVSVLNAIPLPLLATAIVTATAIVVAPRFFPKVTARFVLPKASTIDLPLRMVVGAVLVLSVTYFSSNLGPRLSGIFAMFPVMGTVLAVFSHRGAGREFTINLLRGQLLGWYAFSTFCLSLALMLENSTIALAFSIATAAALAVQIMSRRFVQSH